MVRLLASPDVVVDGPVDRGATVVNAVNAIEMMGELFLASLPFWQFTPDWRISCACLTECRLADGRERRNKTSRIKNSYRCSDRPSDLECVQAQSRPGRRHSSLRNTRQRLAVMIAAEAVHPRQYPADRLKGLDRQRRQVERATPALAASVVSDGNLRPSRPKANTRASQTAKAARLIRRRLHRALARCMSFALPSRSSGWAGAGPNILRRGIFDPLLGPRAHGSRSGKTCPLTAEAVL